MDFFSFLVPSLVDELAWENYLVIVEFNEPLERKRREVSVKEKEIKKEKIRKILNVIWRAISCGSMSMRFKFIPATDSVAGFTMGFGGG
jgi:hypothetical protein